MLSLSKHLPAALPVMSGIKRLDIEFVRFYQNSEGLASPRGQLIDGGGNSAHTLLIPVYSGRRLTMKAFLGVLMLTVAAVVTAITLPQALRSDLQDWAGPILVVALALMSAITIRDSRGEKGSLKLSLMYALLALVAVAVTLVAAYSLDLTRIRREFFWVPVLAGEGLLVWVLAGLLNRYRANKKAKQVKTPVVPAPK